MEAAARNSVDFWLQFNNEDKVTVVTILLAVVSMAAFLWLVIFLQQRYGQPRYKDCPRCRVTIRYRASICPSCAKVIVEERLPKQVKTQVIKPDEVKV